MQSGEESVTLHPVKNKKKENNRRSPIYDLVLNRY